MNVQSTREEAGEMTMVAAWAPEGRAVVNHTTFQSSGQVTCVVGVNGRGSLQMPENEFREYAACIAEAVRVLDGGEPTQ